MNGKYEVVTLCGSTRFKEDMVIIEVENYLPGHFTLTKIEN